MRKRDIFVIGGSAGSLGVLKELVRTLPADFPGSIFIVRHQSPESPSLLAELLAHFGTLPAENASDGQSIEPGRIYVAPADRHLLIEDSRLKLSKGPKENHFRPAIDPLFRSAALACGERVVGVILSGGLDDGTSGLWTVKDCGGVAVVQDPFDAENPSMPLSARQKVEVDHIVAGKDLGDLLVLLSNQEIKEMERDMTKRSDKLEIETAIAAGDEALQKGVLQLGEPSYFTCPECHGVLFEIAEGKNIRFRCHTGHAYSSGTLLADVTDAIENSLWNSIRAMDENVMLLRHLSEHLKTEDAELSDIYSREAQKIERRSLKVRETVMEDGHVPVAK